MKFSLFNQHSIDWKCASAEFKIPTKIVGVSTGDADFQTFYRSVMEECPETERQLRLKIEPVVMEGNKYTWTVTVAGKILKKIHDLASFGHMVGNLFLYLTIRTIPHARPTLIGGWGLEASPDSVVGSGSTSIEASNFRPRACEDQTDCIEYTQENVDVPISSIGTENTSLILTLEAVILDYIHYADYAIQFPNVNKTIFKVMKFPDLEIQSETGKIHECHRIFLCARSSVLDRELSGSFEESKSARIKMEDVSDETIEAFLSFVYYDGIEKAVSCPVTAFELLKLGDYYDIPQLWNAISHIIQQRAISWFTVDAAIKMFGFVSKCEQPDKAILISKLVNVITSSVDRLEGSEEFSKLFAEPLAQQLFSLVASSHKQQ